VLAVFSMVTALLLKKPMYMLPQSIGPLWRKRDCFLLRWILPKFQLVFIRDSISLTVLGECGINCSKCHLVPDMAFVYSSQSHLEGLVQLRTAHAADRRR